MPDFSNLRMNRQRAAQAPSLGAASIQMDQAKQMLDAAHDMVDGLTASVESLEAMDATFPGSVDPAVLETSRAQLADAKKQCEFLDKMYAGYSKTMDAAKNIASIQQGVNPPSAG